MPLHIALFQPDIPGNTGTILRLGACLDCRVHIVEPAGFRLDDKSLRRAGMDYLELAALQRHTDWEQFLKWRDEEKVRLILFTTKAERAYTDFSYNEGDCLLFGRETAGVPDDVHESCDERVTIPMAAQARSLNLAMSVAMGAGEALRQIGR
ncbi:tRNA (cytidine(34)-2'-O)-methyltransferase [Pseudahrensia aquimaris]|uniref:tRNA (cytidine(34)-2'-O)-methyltransferase n=1 Tax=Pseudahrensia aquimaris TaxID=744461 RepID=A0ABW3FD05_9HYPH